MNRLIHVLGTYWPDLAFKRLCQFALVGIGCLGLQLWLVWITDQYAQPGMVGRFGISLGAFALSAQANYVGHRYFTWGDRHQLEGAHSWIKFNLSRLVGYALYAAVVAIAGSSASQLLISLVATVPAWTLNYALGDRWVFTAAQTRELAVTPKITQQALTVGLTDLPLSEVMGELLVPLTIADTSGPITQPETPTSITTS